MIGLIFTASIVGAFILDSHPVSQGEKKVITILTYNIQEGVNEEGEKNFDGQLKFLKDMDADIIGLQECDTARIAGGNSDVVRYFANKLNLYYYFGPRTVTGTFGVALLSKYPIKNAKVLYMYSFKEWEYDREQTACIEAEITIEDIEYTVYVTHLGNGGPISEQKEILGRLEKKENVLLMGDFNFKPKSKQYNLTLEYLIDSWESTSKTEIGDDPVHNDPLPKERIDFIFTSPEFQSNIKYCEFSGGTNSDHPAYYTELKI